MLWYCFAGTDEVAHPVIPPLILRSLHERLTVVRVRLAPAEDVRWVGELARVAGSFDRVQPSDQLLIEVAAFGQWPAADAVEDLTPECETGVETAGGVLLLETSGVTAEHERWLWPEPSLSSLNQPGRTGCYPLASPMMALNFFGSDRNLAA